MIAVALVSFGLLLNIVGAVMFSWSDLRSRGCDDPLLRTGRRRGPFYVQVGRMSWWKRRMLIITQKYAPTDVMAMDQEPLLEAFPREALAS